MKLLPRLKQVVAANAHEIVGRLEDPERMLRQAVREMETSLAEATGAAAQAIAGEKLLARRATQHRQQADAHAARAEQELAAGNEPATREALRRRQAELHLAELIGDEHAVAARANGVLAGQLAQLHAQLREARARLLLLESRQRATAARRQLLVAIPSVDSYAVHRRRFDEFAERVDFIEAETDALCDLASAADDRFDRAGQFRADEAAIEAELATLRTRVAASAAKTGD